MRSCDLMRMQGCDNRTFTFPWRGIPISASSIGGSRSMSWSSIQLTKFRFVATLYRLIIAFLRAKPSSIAANLSEALDC